MAYGIKEDWKSVERPGKRWRRHRNITKRKAYSL